MATFTFRVNGRPQQRDVDPDKPLLWVLREDLGLTGTKFGCGIAMCGACTVLIEDKADNNSPHAMIPVRSCVVRAGDAHDRAITTIEGLSTDAELAVQKAWIAADVPQCGYCQSGQIMTTVALLEAVRSSKSELSDDDIDAGLAGNLCRCGTYVRIREAVKAAARNLTIRVEDDR
jgi:isoquinoline 1-oxidoreductase alpha subunit